MTTTLKHLESHKTPSTNTPPSLPIAPAVQAIIVDRVSIVDPQLTSIVRDNAKAVIATPEKSSTTFQTHNLKEFVLTALILAHRPPHFRGIQGIGGIRRDLGNPTGSRDEFREATEKC